VIIAGFQPQCSHPEENFSFPLIRVKLRNSMIQHDECGIGHCILLAMALHRRSDCVSINLPLYKEKLRIHNDPAPRAHSTMLAW
jgi:hypothetical protein